MNIYSALYNILYFHLYSFVCTFLCQFMCINFSANRASDAASHWPRLYAHLYRCINSPFAAFDPFATWISTLRVDIYCITYIRELSSKKKPVHKPSNVEEIRFTNVTQSREERASLSTCTFLPANYSVLLL